MSTDPHSLSDRGSVAVVVVAAGTGSRFGASVPKAFVTLQGRTLLRWSLDAATACPGVTQVVVVAPSAHLDTARREASRYAAPPVTVVAGGAERIDSVAAGLAAVPDEVDVVLVHDAARALAPTSLFAAVADAVGAGHPAVVPGLSVVDTIKVVDQDGMVTATPGRAWLRAIQTPQGFRRDILVKAHQVRRANHASGSPGAGGATDDAALVEALGVPVLVVPGDRLAHKVTTADDLQRAEAGLAGRGGIPQEPVTGAVP